MSENSISSLDWAGLNDLITETLGPYLERLAEAQERNTEYLKVIAHLMYEQVTGVRFIDMPKDIHTMLYEANMKRGTNE